MPGASCCGASDDASCVRAWAMMDRWLFIVLSSARRSLTFAGACSELEGMAWAASGEEAAPRALSPMGATWGFPSWEGCGGVVLQSFMSSREPVRKGGWSSSFPRMVASVAEARKGSQLMRWVALPGGTTGKYSPGCRDGVEVGGEGREGSPGRTVAAEADDDGGIGGGLGCKAATQAGKGGENDAVPVSEEQEGDTGAVKGPGSSEVGGEVAAGGASGVQGPESARKTHHEPRFTHVLTHMDCCLLSPQWN